MRPVFMLNRAENSAKPDILMRWLLGLILVCTAVSEGYAKGVAPPVQGTPIVWYENGREQTVWMSDTELAEFSSSSVKQPGKALKAVAPQARLKKVIGSTRIWTIDSAASWPLKSLSSAPGGSNYSPVFHRSSSRRGPRLALPGDIIVTFKPQWTREQIGAWALGRRLKISRRLPGTNTFVIKTEAGIAGLELANALYQSGEVLAATPNWWREVFTR